MEIPIDRIRSRKPLYIERASSLNHVSFYHTFAHGEGWQQGLEETLTVVRLGVPEALRRTLAPTIPIELALSVTRRVAARVIPLE
jgi:hypothetical protein